MDQPGRCALEYFRLDECFLSVQIYLLLNEYYYLVRDCFCLKGCVGQHHFEVDYLLYHSLIVVRTWKGLFVKLKLLSGLVCFVVKFVSEGSFEDC